MRRCLWQLARRPVPMVSLYRTSEDGKLRFNGALSINPSEGENVISVSCNTISSEGERTRETTRAIFRRGQGHGHQSSGKMHDNFYWFNKVNGRKEQFLLIKPVLDNIWEASLSIYGEPKYEFEVVNQP